MTAGLEHRTCEAPPQGVYPLLDEEGDVIDRLRVHRHADMNAFSV